MRVIWVRRYETLNFAKDLGGTPAVLRCERDGEPVRPGRESGPMRPPA